MSPLSHQKRVPTGQWNIWTCPLRSVCTAFMLCSRDSDSFSASTSILFISHQESTNYTISIQSRLKTTVTRSQALFGFAEEINIKTKVLKNDHHEAALNQFFSKITLHFLYHCLTVITIPCDHTLTSSGKCSLLDPLFRH